MDRQFGAGIALIIESPSKFIFVVFNVNNLRIIKSHLPFK